MALNNELPLISTVAMGLTLAFGFGLLAHKIRIPPIVGYLLAGVLIGPHTPGMMGDMKIAEELSEIGVVLLMFGVGLHFSIKDLMEVKKIAIPGAIVQIGTAMVMGAGLSMYFWDWPFNSALMFGLALSVASTVVLLRSLEEHNLLQSNSGRIAIGWLIVEDLVMILALVLIPALATPDSGSSSGQLVMLQMLVAIAKLALFIIIMLVGGRRILPWLLNAVAKTRSRELFTLAVFASAMGVAFGAAQVFDVSFALGAFFAGMMIKESDLNHEVADRSLPFQDAFAVLFFVSVGMLFDPSIIIRQPIAVLVSVFIIVVGKSLAALAIISLMRYPLKTGLIVAAGLAQIGEFSFILVGLGLSNGLLPAEGRDLILAGALVSIMLNPLLFSMTHIIYNWTGNSKRLSYIFNVTDHDLMHLQRDEKRSLKDLVILVGHGRVGKHISQNIQGANIDLVVIDTKRSRVDALRNSGFHAIAGDARHHETLMSAAIEKAVAIAVAIPDPFEARRIVEVARDINPNIKVLVRAHNEGEIAYFSQLNVDLALMGAEEIGRSMTHYLNNMRDKTV